MKLVAILVIVVTVVALSTAQGPINMASSPPTQAAAANTSPFGNMNIWQLMMYRNIFDNFLPIYALMNGRSGGGMGSMAPLLFWSMM